MNRHPSCEHQVTCRLRRILGPVRNGLYVVGIGDDAAVRRTKKGERLVLTADALVEDVHFSLRYMNLRDVLSRRVSFCCVGRAVSKGTGVYLRAGDGNLELITAAGWDHLAY